MPIPRSAHTRFVWTDATTRWWLALGHADSCECPVLINGGQRTVTGDEAASIWDCWNRALTQFDRLTPRDTVHATRAMFAFRDRARVIRAGSPS